eukprot:EG_transcript_10559
MSPGFVALFRRRFGAPLQTAGGNASASPSNASPTPISRQSATPRPSGVGPTPTGVELSVAKGEASHSPTLELLPEHRLSLGDLRRNGLRRASTARSVGQHHFVGQLPPSVTLTSADRPLQPPPIPPSPSGFFVVAEGPSDLEERPAPRSERSSLRASTVSLSELSSAPSLSAGESVSSLPAARRKSVRFLLPEDCSEDDEPPESPRRASRPVRLVLPGNQGPSSRRS